MSVRIICEDALAALRETPDESINCCITSPPYWGLRDYGVDGQYGLELSLGEHIARMVEVFEEIRRVLTKDGTCWVNYGDCYAASPNGRSAADVKALGNDDRTFRDKPISTTGPVFIADAEKGDRRGTPGSKQWTHDQGEIPHTGRVIAGGYLKPKDLCMVPNRLAIALQDAGWWVRSEIIWGKPNPMPESVTDRPATAHEKIWMLTKSGRYWYDAESVRVGRAQDYDANTFRGGSYVGGEPSKRKKVGNKRVKMPDGWDTGPGAHGSYHRNGREKGKQRGHSRRHAGFNERWDEMERAEQIADGRNLRNYEPAPLEVWEMATRPFPEAHFATFPPELAERCIKAGCPVGGLVLDPFAGAGTTGLVADRLGRNAILIELNPEYCEMIERRLRADSPMFCEIEAAQ